MPYDRKKEDRTIRETKLREHRKKNNPTHPPRNGLSLTMAVLGRLARGLVPFGRRRIADGTSQLANNLVEIVNLIRKHESPNIGDGTGEIAGVIVLPAGVLLVLRDHTIMVDDGGSDIEQEEAEVRLLEDRHHGRSMRRVETAGILDKGKRSFHRPPAVIRKLNIFLGEEMRREIAHGKLSDGIGNADLGEADSQGIIMTGGNKFAEGVLAENIVGRKALLGSVSGQGKGEETVEGVAGNRKAIRETGKDAVGVFGLDAAEEGNAAMVSKDGEIPCLVAAV